MLEQKMHTFIDETEQQREKLLNTWQYCLGKTLELQVQECICQDKQQREENEGWRLGLERILEQKKIQNLIDRLNSKERMITFGSRV